MPYPKMIFSIYKAGFFLLALLMATLTVQAEPLASTVGLEPSAFNCATATEIPLTECQALVDLYNQTDGPNWINRTDWLLTTTPCQWHGVICASGHVIQLWLDGNNLTGLIPQDLAKLPRLAQLGLHDNQLSGGIPVQLGELVNLGLLYLHNNQLTGPIPAIVGNWKKLGEIDLSGNALEGAIPKEFGSLPSLNFLKLYQNRLTGSIPSELGNVPLRGLNLNDNGLRGEIPLQLINLCSTLEEDWLNLRYNAFLTTNLTALGCLNQKNPGWEQTQTVPPTNITGTFTATINVSLAWTPISYTNNAGYYEISYATASDGPYTVLGITTNKVSHSYPLPGLASSSTYYFRLRTYTPAHGAQQNELWSEYSSPVPITLATPTATPTATNPPTPTATPTSVTTPAAGTPTEPNDLCDQANVIKPDGLAQEQTFQTAADTDWVRFAATSAVRYRIEVIVPPGSPADVDLELYPACDQLPNLSQSPNFSPNIRLDFKATQTGPIFLRLTNHTAMVAGAQVAYQLSVRVLDEDPPDRALIILAGRLKDSDSLQRNIHHVTGRVYALFQKNGYDSSNMQYLATDPSLPGYTGAATKENLRAAITTWATQQLEPNGVLTLYLIDHGKPDLLFIDELNGQRVTPSELDEWLLQLENQVPGVKINVIIEACQSGSFITLPGSISRANRLLMTSTTAEADAKASYEGAYFSDHFLTGLAQGSNVYNSFFEARRVAKQIFALQEAWVDGDGDGQPNELEDAAVAASRGFNYPGTFDDPWPPHIFSVHLPTSLINASGEVSVDVRDDVKVRLVWGVVYPPDYVPSPAGQELQPEVLPTFLLSDQGDNQFAGKYTGFTQAGTYRIVVQAEDNEGLKARPVVIEVNTGGRAYLPLVRR